MTKHQEHREHTGLRELSRSVGRILVEIVCPFCGDSVRAYLWSLAGSGKRCECGAVLGQSGAWR